MHLARRLTMANGNFGLRLRLTREHLGLTQTDIARLCQRTYAWVSQNENGRTTRLPVELERFLDHNEMKAKRVAKRRLDRGYIQPTPELLDWLRVA